MLRFFAAVIAAAALSAGVRAQEPAATPDRFAALRFMIGTWRGEQSGQPGRGVAERTYQLVLDGRFIQETNTSTHAAEVHHHISLIGYDSGRKRFVFRQFHSEGFVNTYVQTASSDPTTIVFVSEAIENIPAGYRARETYTIVNPDQFTERFDVAEPGKEFTLYSEARLRRVR